MGPHRQHVYRGTTLEWPGSQSAQRERRTCASFDPLVATLFAIQARNYGPAVVYLFEPDESTVFQPGNVFQEIEDEIVIAISPAEFAELAISFQRGDRLSNDQKRQFDAAVFGGGT